MSAKNVSSNTLKSYQAFNINQIHLELRAEYENIIHQIQRRMFFDPGLNYRQQMFLLHQPAAVENEFILYLYECIYNMNISEDPRDSLLMNLHTISEQFIHIDSYSGINRQPIPYNDSDADDYAPTTTPVNSSEFDITAEFENQLLEDIESQQDIAAFPLSTNDADESSFGHETSDI